MQILGLLVPCCCRYSLNTILCIFHQLSLIKLLDYEARAADQVPLLMRMSKDELALQKAVDSGDTELGICTNIHLSSVSTNIHFSKQL